MPISIYRKFMEPVISGNSYVIPFYLQPNTTSYLSSSGSGKIRSDVIWDNPDEVPDNVKKALKLPQNDFMWEINGETHEYGKYCFFVGYRVVD